MQLNSECVFILSSQRTRKEADKKDRKLLDNDFSTPTKHHRKAVAPPTPISPQGKWEPRLPALVSNKMFHCSHGNGVKEDQVGSQKFHL